MITSKIPALCVGFAKSATLVRFTHVCKHRLVNSSCWFFFNLHYQLYIERCQKTPNNWIKMYPVLYKLNTFFVFLCFCVFLNNKFNLIFFTWFPSILSDLTYSVTQFVWVKNNTYPCCDWQETECWGRALLENLTRKQEVMGVDALKCKKVDYILQWTWWLSCKEKPKGYHKTHLLALQWTEEMLSTVAITLDLCIF